LIAQIYLVPFKLSVMFG